MFSQNECWVKTHNGPSIIDVRKKSLKIDPLPLVHKMSALAKPPPPLFVRTHRKFWKIRCFLHQKGRTSSSESPHDCGRLLWTAP